MTTIRVKTTVDVSKIEGAAKQTPYALSVAINEALKKAQAKQRQKMQGEFTIRRKAFVDLSVKITKFAKKTTLVGELAIAPPGNAADIFGKFEKGGTKRPKDGHSLAVPVIGSPVKKTRRTVVSDQNRPRVLLSDATEVTTRTGATKGVKRAKKFNGAFLRPAKDGKPGAIFMRFGDHLKLAYSLKPTAEIKPELHFVDTVTKSVSETWESDFAEAFAKAMATRKR